MSTPNLRHVLARAALALLVAAEIDERVSQSAFSVITGLSADANAVRPA
jgi:hypothetical protein